MRATRPALTPVAGKDAGRRHGIVPDGYDRGRDWLVARAVAGGAWRGTRWKAAVEWRAGLLEPGRRHVNHNISQDGRTAVLTVFRL